MYRSIQDRYAAQCDGDWEHGFGVKIETLDNPGWTVSIDLTGTALEDVEFTEISNIEPEIDWIQCSVQEGLFEGACGPRMLETLLSSFLDWANRSQRPAP